MMMTMMPSTPASMAGDSYLGQQAPPPPASEPQSAVVSWDPAATAGDLQLACEILQERGLVLAAQWAAEQWMGLPLVVADDLSSTTATTFQHECRPLLFRHTGDDRSSLLQYARTLVATGEFGHAAALLSSAGSQNPQHVVVPPIAPPRSDLSPAAIALRAYAVYMAGERWAEERHAQTTPTPVVLRGAWNPQNRDEEESSPQRRRPSHPPSNLAATATATPGAFTSGSAGIAGGHGGHHHHHGHHHAASAAAAAGGPHGDSASGGAGGAAMSMMMMMMDEAHTPAAAAATSTAVAAGTNPYLSQLARELRPLYHQQVLDPFGLYVYGVVTAKQQQQRGQSMARRTTQHPPPHLLLLESLLQFPYNWSAWLDLADCVAKAHNQTQLERDIEQTLQSTPLVHHFLYHLFCAHLQAHVHQDYATALHIYQTWMGQTAAPSNPATSGGGGSGPAPPPVDDDDEDDDSLWPSTPAGRGHGANTTTTPHPATTTTTNAAHWLFGGSPYLMTQTAVTYYHLRQFHAAQRLLEDLHTTMPFRLDSMDVYSNILYVQEDAVALAQLAHRATLVDKYRPETCCIVGNYYSLKQDRARAVKAFGRALAVDPTYVSAWTLLGHEYVEWKQTAYAMECYRQATKVAPHDYRAWYGLGQTYELLAMYMYALYYYQQATQLRPYDARMWAAMGQVYSQLGQASDAIRAYERALQQEDTEGLATQKLAALYEEQGQEEKAAQCYFQHLQLRYQITHPGGNQALATTTTAGGAATSTSTTVVDLTRLLQDLVVEETEAEALLYLATYHKNHGAYETAALFCSRLLEYPGPERDMAKAMLRELRSRTTSGGATAAAAATSSSHAAAASYSSQHQVPLVEPITSSHVPQLFPRGRTKSSSNATPMGAPPSSSSPAGNNSNDRQPPGQSFEFSP